MEYELTARGSVAVARLGTTLPDADLETATAVVSLLYRERNVLSVASVEASSLGGDFQLQADRDARAKHLAIVLGHVRARRRVPLVILAFPAKSPNPSKSISESPDLGDLWGLVWLDQLCRKVEQLYSPGARITVCTDGHVFSDLVRVADHVVDDYRSEIQALIRTENLANLDVYGLGEVFGNRGGWDAVRARLMAEFGEAPELQRQRLAADARARAQWSGIHRFVFEDTLALRPGLTRNRARELAKHDAYEVVRRSNAFSALVAETFPAALRLSIHPQPLGSSKIGVKLVPGGDRWATPWHNAPLVSGGAVSLIRREAAEARGARIAYRDSKGKHLAFYVDDQAPKESPL